MTKLIHNKAVILDTGHSPHVRLRPVPVDNISLEQGFWQTRVLLNQTVTIPTQFQLLDKTGRLDNFRRVSGEIDKAYQGYVFNDSDVYKWLEAASWTMAYCHDGQLQQSVDHVISLISKAQDKNGYINTFFSLEKSNERWTNLSQKHELYCAGHLIQAAIAHYRVTAEEKLLNVAVRLADHIQSTFGKDGREGTSGHPEIEVALVELYRTTRQLKYLEQAALFIDRRGTGLLGGWEYLVDHIPFRNLELMSGHAVRALYLCCGATDLLIETGEQQLHRTIKRLWKNLVNQLMYVTGGVGSRHDGEAFGKPYELPNARAYAETCAAIASVMWNFRLLQLDGNPRYADLMEWTIYNAVLPGISINAKEYFYNNPLRDNGELRRQSWFDCACCPPNICRTIAMFPGYMYNISEEGIWVHLYAQSKASFDLVTGQRVKLHQTTRYPWEGLVSLQITDLQSSLLHGGSSTSAHEFSIFIRIPGWLGDGQAEIKINGIPFSQYAASGSYLEIHRNWQNFDIISMDFPIDVRYIESHPLVDENYRRVAVARGPIVYCLEAVDNPSIVLSEIRINPAIQPGNEFLPDLLGGINRLHLSGAVRPMDDDWENKLYRPNLLSRDRAKDRKIELIFIPYYAWANRKPGAMQIWQLVH
jgi:DUF1680 family protein